MRSSRTKAFFVTSLCLASFGYGIATAYFQVFPFTILQNARRAWSAVSEDADVDTDHDVDDVRGLTEPVARRLSNGAGDELILVAGGEGYLQEHSVEGHGCLAWIMDRQGRVMHVWEYDAQVWAHLEKAIVIPGQQHHASPIGMHLYPNGDLLVSYHAKTFPYGLGLAKFNKDSKLLWKKESLNHHWFTVAPDGKIISPAFKVVDSPCRVGETRFSLSAPDGKWSLDTVQILDANGDLLDEIDVLEALIQSGWAGLLATQNASEVGTNHERFVITSSDPTHLNGVQVVDRETAAAHAWLREGDLLLSMRSLNAIGILDPLTKRFKWMSGGACIQLHSPRLHKDGVLVLDNRGGSAAAGGSRLVQIDLENPVPRTVFPQPSSLLPSAFYVAVAGHFDFGASDRALLAMYESQKVWEIDLRTGQVLWEYLCVDARQHKRRRLATSKYVGNVSFPFNR